MTATSARVDEAQKALAVWATYANPREPRVVSRKGVLMCMNAETGELEALRPPVSASPAVACG